MQDVQQTLISGTLIRERYLIKSLIGRGDSGAVYLVEDQRAKQAGQQVFALKETSGLSKQERIQLTIKSVTLRQVNHLSLPHVHHVFNDDRRGRVGIIMDFVDGPDLETLYQQQPHQRFRWSEVERLMAPIFDAVSYLHRQAEPIMHGDIKPVNILLAQPGEHPLLVDIGVVKEAGAESSAVFHLSGYKAPEQYGKSVDERADIYGLGATCYTLLTGIVPTDAIERGTRIRRGQADPLQAIDAVVPTVHPHVARAIHQSLSIHTPGRFASVQEFWQALQAPPQAPVKEDKPAVSETVPPVAAPTPVKKPAPVPPIVPQTPVPAFLEQSKQPVSMFSAIQRRLVAVGLIVIILLAGAGIGIWSLSQSQHAPSSDARNTSTPAARSTTPTGEGTVSISTPTSSPGTYPSIVGSFAGTIVDISITSNAATMILQGVHQVSGTIDGYFTAGPPLGISGPFKGTIDHSKNLQFIVRDTAGRPVLFVEGAIQTATYLSGDFYRCAPTTTFGASCARAPKGSGIWSAKLVTPGG